MKTNIIIITCLLFAATLLPAGLSAQAWPDSLDLVFGFEGIGNMVTMSPPVYSGDITGGSAELSGGTWMVEIDDSQWPDTTDYETRWNYIFDNYFEYTGTGWEAVFNGTNLPEKPHWEINTSNGSLYGTLVLSVVMSDCDLDGVLDIEDRQSGSFSGTMMVMKYGTGYFSKYCGDGAYNGSFSNSDPANFADDFVWGNGALYLIDCSIGTEEITWGAVKSMNR